MKSHATTRSSEHRPRPCASRAVATLAALGLASAAALGCSQAPPPADFEPPVTTVPEPTPVSAEPTPAPRPARPERSPEEEARAQRGEVLIDSGTPTSASPSLLEASRRAKARKAQAKQPVAVITDENLHEYASRGKLTMASPDNPSSARAEKAPEPDAAEQADALEGETVEAYWSRKIFEIRQQWSETADEVTALQARAEALRTEFYAADDPRYRDTRIKPAWDRVLDRIEEANADLERYQGQLTAAIDQGRRAGASPGALRTGIELQPIPREERSDLEEQDIIEPVVLEDPP